ncbi:MAG: HEPN domain-containing protein [Kiritimatiellae bacterium]|nr:HEPN domain-containing protein [Kiritimatiellia bacterium]
MKALTDTKVLAEKSKANFCVADSWATDADYDSAASRYYYSVLQSVMYYAVRKQCSELQKYESHAPGYSIHGLMGSVAGQISPHYRKTMLELYQVRRQADYRSNHVSEDDLNDILDDAKELMKAALAV